MEDGLSLAQGPRVGDSNVSHLQLWQDVVEAQPDATALISQHQSPNQFPWIASRYHEQDFVQWTFDELDSGARRAAISLSRLAHIERRPLVAFINNQAEWALFFWAAAYLHSPFVPVNPKIATRATELNHMLSIVRPVAILAADGRISVQLEKSMTPKLFASIPIRLILSLAEGGSISSSWCSLSGVIPQTQSPPDTPDRMIGEDLSLILFTSGTTSLPKPCGLTSFQCANAALGYMDAHQINSNHRFVQHLPGFHSYGIGWSLGIWLRGAALIFPSEFFEAHSTLQCFTHLHATHMCLVPTTAQAILSHPTLSTTDLSTLISIDISGAGVLPSLIEACMKIFKVPCCSSYGMTESPGTLAWPSHAGSVIRNGKVMSGRPQRNTMVKICEPGTRSIVAHGQVGELHNGGEQVIHCYMDPRASLSDFYEDDKGIRWIISGDQAIMDDDGTVRISGRYKDMIIRGGENISPASIEEYLCKCQDIVAAYVVGQEDEMAGEVPIAVISTANSREVDVNSIKQAASDDLGPAFAPKMILHLENHLGRTSFPTTASGKVRKVELKGIVSEYLKKQCQVPISTAGSTVDTLLVIWQSISGATGLTATSLLDAFADSLMMMQLSGSVKKNLGRDITVEDFKLCESIQQQADLIDSRPLRVQSMQVSRREGPPTIKDVVHAHGDMRVFNQCQEAVSKVLAPLRLSWRDVEDVITLHDWAAIFCRQTRPSSWSIRFGYHAPVDVDTLAAAIKTSLEFHPTMRSLALDGERGEMLLVTVRSTSRWFDAAIATGLEVNTKDELSDLLADRHDLQVVNAPVPLMKFYLVKIRDSNTSGLITVGCHAVHDMSMTKLWLDDVLTLLTSKDKPVLHGLYADWASAFYVHRDGPEAIDSVKHWAKKYQRIGFVSESTFWPPQRAPEWFKGNDEGWSRWNGSRARKGERSVPLAEKSKAQRGIGRRVAIQDIQGLKATHGVPVFMLVKAALALLNVARTGAKEAIFGTINAARKWPFSSDYSALERETYSTLNPLDISGCTTQYVLDRIPVSPNKPVLAFMQQVDRDEEINNAFIHAPFHSVVDHIRDVMDPDDSRTFAERDRDAEVILPLIRRQSFNWLPTGRAAQDPRGLTFHHHITRMDNGLTVTGFLDDDKRNVVLSFTWDAEHLTLLEANAAIDLLADLVGKLGKHEHWGLSVGELIRGCV